MLIIYAPGVTDAELSMMGYVMVLRIRVRVERLKCL